MTHFKLPELPYALDALEPIISQKIMSLHYNKHHNTYVTNLNKALDQYAEAEKNNDIPKMIELQSAIKFNGGGHINHSIFWTNLAPKNQGGGNPPKGELFKAVEAKWKSLDGLIEEMSNKGVAIQGSGWVWLGLHNTKKCLMVSTCANQDPLSTLNFIPLLGIDVWEHAYYLQYENARADYVKAIWGIINWKNVEDRYESAMKGLEWTKWA